MAKVAISSIFVILVSFVVMISWMKFSDIAVQNGSENVDNTDGLDTKISHTIDTPSSFSFFQCGDDPKSQPIQINTFSIKPDPLVLPGVIKFKVSLQVKEEIQGPIRASLRLEKHTKDGWYSLPCNEEGYGSCQYQDVCPSLKNLDPICPKDVTDKGRNCNCPLQPGKYSFKTLKLPVAAELAEGPIHLVANFTLENGRLVTCLDTTVILEKGKMYGVDQHNVQT